MIPSLPDASRGKVPIACRSSSTCSKMWLQKITSNSPSGSRIRCTSILTFANGDPDRRSRNPTAAADRTASGSNTPERYATPARALRKVGFVLQVQPHQSVPLERQAMRTQRIFTRIDVSVGHEFPVTVAAPGTEPGSRRKITPQAACKVHHPLDITARLHAAIRIGSIASSGYSSSFRASSTSFRLFAAVPCTTGSARRPV